MTEQKMCNNLYVTELRPGIYLFDEAHARSGYLVVGKKKACMIDTMQGENNLMEAVRALTDLPVFVINTHGHGDHILGNACFTEAYMHPADKALADSFLRQPEVQKICDTVGGSFPPFQDTFEGDEFDLGGRTLRVIELPGHTKGSIILLLKEDRLLFSGDSINHHLWMQLDGCMPLNDYVKELEKVLYLEQEADFILHGHSKGLDDISLIRALQAGLVEICEEKTAGDLPYQYFGGTCLQHPFSVFPGKQYATEESVIVYNGT